MSTTETWSGQRPRELNEETIDAVRRRIGIPTAETSCDRAIEKALRVRFDIGRFEDPARV